MGALMTGEGGWASGAAARDVRVAAIITGGSTAGDMAAQAALTLRLHDHGGGWATGSGWAVTLLLLANSVPPLLCAPFVGRLADGVDSRRTLVGAGWLCAVLCVGLAFAAAPGWLLSLVGCVAAVSSAATATLGALVPVMVGRSGVVRAGSALRGAVMIGGVAGLALGAAATGPLGTTAVVLLDAATFALLGTGAVLIRARRGGRLSVVRPDGPGFGGPPGAVRGGAPAQPRAMSWLATASYATVMLLVATTNVAQVFFVRDTLGADDTSYGLVSGCWIVGTALALPPLRRMAPDPERLLRTAILGELVVGAGIAGCGAAASLPATAVLYALAGAGACAMQVAVGAVLQLGAPERRRGRQLAYYGAVIKVAGVAALGLGGVLLDRVGAQGTYLASGVGSVAIAVAAGLAWRTLRGTASVDTTITPLAPIDTPPRSLLAFVRARSFHHPVNGVSAHEPGQPGACRDSRCD